MLAFKLVQTSTAFTAGDYNLLKDLLRVINEMIFFFCFASIFLSFSILCSCPCPELNVDFERVCEYF